MVKHSPHSLHNRRCFTEIKHIPKAFNKFDCFEQFHLIDFGSYIYFDKIKKGSKNGILRYACFNKAFKRRSRKIKTSITLAKLHIWVQYKENPQSLQNEEFLLREALISLNEQFRHISSPFEIYVSKNFFFFFLAIKHRFFFLAPIFVMIYVC